MNEERVYKFNGTGFLVGVPARDLTEEEAKRFNATNHPLWKKQTAKKAVKSDKDGE